MIKTGIMGHPLNWTLSPKLHNFMFKYLNIKGHYYKLKTEPEELYKMIKYIRDKNFRGVNITIPYKEKIIKYIDELNTSASSIGAVNTIVSNNGRLIGYNTDVYGFKKSLDFHNIKIEGMNVIILGTGGASRACAKVICKSCPNNFAIVGRNRERTEILGKKYGADIIRFEDINKIIDNTDLLVNATPIFPQETIIKMKEGSIYYDLKYKDIPKQIEGIRVVNGLIMLIYQGINSFYLWTNKIVSEKIIIEKGGLT